MIDAQLLTRSQYPANEVKELHDQLSQIQDELHESGVSHEGRTAEEEYADRLKRMTLEEGVVHEGPEVVATLLARCLLWVEIVEEK